MPITETDLLFKYTGTGSTTNPALALGGTLGVNTIPSGIANNIFDDVTGDESQTGKQEYRAIGIHNTLSGYIFMNTKAYITGYARSGTSFDVIYFGTEKPAGTVGSPDGTIQIIASDSVAPSGISWIEEGSPSSTISISGKDYVGSIGADDWSAIWLQRSVPVTAAAYNNRSCTLRVEGETSASPEIYHLVVDFKITWKEKEFSIEKIFSQALKAVI